MAAWIRIGHGMRYVAHGTFLGSLAGGCGIAALQIYSVGVEEIPVTARDPIVASRISRQLRPSYLEGLPYADAFEYPVPLQWLAQMPDATEFSRSMWLCWAFRLQHKVLTWLSLPGSQVSTRHDIEEDGFDAGTNLLGHFDVLEKTRDGSSLLCRFGTGPDPRDQDGLIRFTVAIEDDLAVFGLHSAMWSATTPDWPTWLAIRLHEIYARLLLKAAVQRMLRPKEERKLYDQTGNLEAKRSHVTSP